MSEGTEYTAGAQIANIVMGLWERLEFGER